MQRATELLHEKRFILTECSQYEVTHFMSEARPNHLIQLELVRRIFLSYRSDEMSSNFLSVQSHMQRNRSVKIVLLQTSK